MTEQFRPHPENQKLNAPEPAAGPLGIPPPSDTEQAAKGGEQFLPKYDHFHVNRSTQGSKSPERQALPSVWEVLERDVRFGERFDKDEVDLTVPFETLFTNQEYKEGEHELDEVKRLANEIREKGTVYDKLILDLYNTVTLEPSGFPVLIPYNIPLSREEYQQFHSKFEALPEEELAEEIRKAQEDFKRREETHPGRRPPPPGSIIDI